MDIKSFINNECNSIISNAIQPIQYSFLVNLFGEELYNKIRPYFIDNDNLILIDNQSEEAYQIIYDLFFDKASIISFNENDMLIEIYIDKNVGYIIKVNNDMFIWNSPE